MFLLVIAAYAVCFMLEFIPLYKKKLRPDLWTNAVLGIISFTVALLLSLNVKIPNPIKPVTEFIEFIIGK